MSKMGLIKFLEGIGKRLLLTNRELNSISQEKPGDIFQDNLTKIMQDFTKMIFNDFFQIEGYSDAQYRQHFQEISDVLKENPVLTAVKYAHLKRFSDFSRAMHKNLRKYLKNELGDLLAMKFNSKPSDLPLI